MHQHLRLQMWKQAPCKASQKCKELWWCHKSCTAERVHISAFEEITQSNATHPFPAPTSQIFNHVLLPRPSAGSCLFKRYIGQLLPFLRTCRGPSTTEKETKRGLFSAVRKALKYLKDLNPRESTELHLPSRERHMDTEDPVLLPIGFPWMVSFVHCLGAEAGCGAEVGFYGQIMFTNSGRGVLLGSFLIRKARNPRLAFIWG